MVQTTKEPKMPMGISFRGFLASCAAVDTASKPINAKNTIPAPVKTPYNPWFQNLL